MNYIVELQRGCWLAPWRGDPGRTLVRVNARKYKTIKGANIALGRSKIYRDFPNSKIKNIKK